MIFSKSKSPPPPADDVTSDRIIPLHFFEDSPLVQGNNMAVSLVFDEVLDPEKLRSSLENLVQRHEGWERLGGRLKKNAKGKIEWHIPSTFTPSRPAISYTHIHHTIPSTAHPRASKIPSPGNRPAIVGDPDDLAPLAWGEGSEEYAPPRGISDYLGDEDRPVLGLRVHSFTDRTVVVLSWQHVAFDALGMKAVVQAWEGVLSGKKEIPVPVRGDPFSELGMEGEKGEEEHVLRDKRLSVMGMLRWGMGYGVDMLVREKENRMVCVPERCWRGWWEVAVKELREEETQKTGGDPESVFLTENDVLTAWILRCVVVSMGMDPGRTVAGSIAMSLRKAFQGDLLPEEAEGRPYVGNAFGWANVLVTAGDVVSRPLGWLAREVRRAINEQGTREQHTAYYAMVRASRAGLPVVLFGDGGMYQVGFSNWTKAGLFGLDFSPARMDGDKTGPCRPVYVQENHGPIKPADGFFVLGKDEKGNYWLSACKVKGQWAKFEELLEAS
ncbi:hypothetical protein QBC47DRAFT_313557 [Echria macrotheca]|uniref:Uncharacterized protein n=1 Tax=Echria macrotheca TaxID=438768 RepID=A0AAJ0FHJ6_9PEZI|nr:hypothetical protein QBC47DRAFT_313557 [Echria macrotheca]